jgi:hypothetical protein
MAQIYIRGQKPIKTDREKALKIKAMFEDNAIPANTVVALDGISVRKEDIKFVMLDDEETQQDKKLQTGTNSVNDIEKQHQDNIDARLALSIIDRAKVLDEFNTFFEIVTGRKPTQEEKLQGAKAQLAFYKEYNYAFPDLSIFKSIVEEKLKPTLSMIETTILNILSKHCASGYGRVSRREYAKQHEQSNLV